MNIMEVQVALLLILLFLLPIDTSSTSIVQTSLNSILGQTLIPIASQGGTVFPTRVWSLPSSTRDWRGPR